MLLLGSSESLSALTEGLRTINAKHKLFRRAGPMALPYVERKPRGNQAPPLPGKAPPLAKVRQRPSDGTIAHASMGTLLGCYAPPAIVVNQEHEAVHLFGEVNAYLAPREGVASLEINRLLPESLTPVAAALLYKATRDRNSIVSDLLDVTLPSGERRTLRLAAHPVPTEGEERLTLLCFETPPLAADRTAETPVDVDAETMARVAVLERELAATRESLQATIEELETSNEELQATNEELMASNEELQSSNEELQSVNEEMSTVNAEFQEKMLVLNRLNADLDSMAKAAGVATIFLDADLHITRFSPDATQIFKLRESDIGRPLDDIAHQLRHANLMDDLRQTLLTQRSIEAEIPTRDDKKTYLLRILPYLVPSTSIHGVVATFVDMTAFHDARRLQAILDALPEHVAVLDPAGTIVMVNAAWRRFAQANGDRQLTHSGPGVNYLAVCHGGQQGEGDADADRAYRGLRGVLEGSLPFFSLEYPCHSPTEERWFLMHVAPVMSQGIGAVVSHIHVSAWQRGRAS